ncbi:MAG: hypothetical protein RLZZ436_3589, partial [Planctomycetota bacterium]
HFDRGRIDLQRSLQQVFSRYLNHIGTGVIEANAFTGDGVPSRSESEGVRIVGRGVIVKALAGGDAWEIQGVAGAWQAVSFPVGGADGTIGPVSADVANPAERRRKNSIFQVFRVCADNELS